MEQHLQHLLDELQAAIKRVRHQEDQEELTRLQGAVEQRLKGGGDDQHSGLVDALEKAEIRFESDHPTLAQSLRQTIEVLSAAGI